MNTYSLSDEQKQQYAGIYLLRVMINEPRTFSVMLEGNDQDLQPVLDWLMMKDYIEIKDNADYIPNDRGREVLKRFMARYSEFLQMFDVYCAVDVEAGEFAFARYFDVDDDAAWQRFLDDDRWDDLRIAVAEFKKIDPIEIVFMSFLNEERFGRDATGWQFDLLLGSVWDDILEICNAAIHYEELAFEDEQGAVSAEVVITDIVSQGSELMITLLEEEEQQRRDTPGDNGRGGDAGFDDEREVDPVYVEEHPAAYYYPYRDPFYVSPLWLGLLLI
ncbi:MAG: hypothetical protein GY868_04390 [Deltaproteobacteria bacterium]|nr:hypothetical protein [Deltaproteobacteria bacterium]